MVAINYNHPGPCPDCGVINGEHAENCPGIKQRMAEAKAAKDAARVPEPSTAMRFGKVVEHPVRTH